MILKTVLILISIALVCSLSGCIDNSEAVIETAELSTPVLDAAMVKLPDKPDKFDLIKRNFYDSQIDDFNNLEEGMWKRPEFYPTWERSGIHKYIDHDYTRWGVHGYGFFPGEQSWAVNNMQEGDEMVFHTFLHTAWGVETWQGMQLVPVYDDTLFDVTITPNEFYLEPTFPVFYPEWTKIIEFRVVAIDTIPAGEYIITLKVLPPDESRTEEWSWEVLDKFTDELYHSEIEKCKENPKLETCDELIQLRQTKYVSGSMFTPSKVFKCVIEAS